MNHRTEVPVLIDYVLSGGSSFLVFGNSLPFRSILARIQQRYGTFRPLDLRGVELDEAELRTRALERIQEAGVLVILTGEDLSSSARAIVQEILEGQLNTRHGVEPVESARVIALSSGGQPSADSRELFGLALASYAALRPSLTQAARAV